MRSAFEASVCRRRCRTSLEFLEETGGPAAVARVREAGTDRFEVRTFKKLDCARDNDRTIVCNFSRST